MIKGRLARCCWLVLLFGPIAGMVLLLLLGEGVRHRERRRALSELIEVIDHNGRGYVQISVGGFWVVAQYLGVPDEFCFTDCFVSVNKGTTENGEFLTQISDVAMTLITEFEAMDTFYDNENLSHINRMGNLKRLNLDFAYKPDYIFSSLDPRKVPYLREIFCQSNGSGLSDSGLRQSKIIPQLTILELEHCGAVTDASVPVLAQGKRLKFLFLYKTGISDEGFRRVQGELGVIADVAR